MSAPKFYHIQVCSNNPPSPIVIHALLNFLKLTLSIKLVGLQIKRQGCVNQVLVCFRKSSRGSSSSASRSTGSGWAAVRASTWRRRTSGRGVPCTPRTARATTGGAPTRRGTTGRPCTAGERPEPGICTCSTARTPRSCGRPVTLNWRSFVCNQVEILSLMTGVHKNTQQALS